MGHSMQFHDGFRCAIKFAVTAIHKEAARMNDPKARMFYNNMAFWLGVEMAKKTDNMIDIESALSAYDEYQKSGGDTLENLKKELGL